MRFDLKPIENEILPIATAHGAELVALEWFQGPGHGILRVSVDLPDNDPYNIDPAKSVSIDTITAISRDISTTLDALDNIESAYTLEVTSPGPERPVQKRKDFERFKGFSVRMEVRDGRLDKPKVITGTLQGCTDDVIDQVPTFAVKVRVGDQTKSFTAEQIHKARLRLDPDRLRIAKHVGEPESPRQKRLREREKARAINAMHLAKQEQLQSQTQAPTQDSVTQNVTSETTRTTVLTNAAGTNNAAGDKR